MIRLENVSKYYASGDNNVSLGLHNISLEMNKGEIIGIVGESGSGKSTFLNVVSGLDTFEDGEVYYGDTPVSSFTPEELGEFRKNHIGFIFQNYNLIDSYTVLQNVLMPLLIKGVTGKEAKEKAKEIIKKVGLEHRINHKGTKLSGGERQRCVIARALASDSEILACDEPTGNLDSKTGREIIELIKEVSKDKLVLIVTHNYDELKDIITRRLTFADGNLIEDKDLTTYEAENDELSPNGTYKFSFKEKLKLSSKDILSTPKKSILSFLIFIAISAFVAYLYTGLLTYKNSYSDPSIFSNSLKNRYVVYEKDKPFNYDDFNNDYNNYANIEDEQFSFSSDSVSKGSFFYRYDISDVKLKKGRMPEADNEIIIGVPEQTLQTCYKNSVTISILPRYYENEGLIDIDDTKYEVVGYYNIPDTSMNTYLITGTNYLKNRLIDSYLAFDFYSNTGSFWLNESVLSTQIKINNEVEKNVINFYFSKELEGKINNMSNLIDIKYRNAVIDAYKTIDKSKYNINILYEVPSYDDYGTKVEFSYETLKSLSKEINPYISIYLTDQAKIDNVYQTLGNKGYGVCNAKEAYLNEDISIASIFNTILYAFYIIGVLFAFIVVFLISYFVLARIYSVKNKDYTVFRTLGMDKKDMASIVRIQTVIQSMIAAIFVIIVALVTYLIGKPVIKGFNRIGVLGVIVYLIFMFVYSLFFAQKFNKKLYKFSVSKTFRGGMLGND